MSVKLICFSGNPKHIRLALAVGPAGGNEEEIGEPVDIFERRRADDFAVCPGKVHHQPLRPPCHGAGNVQCRCSTAATRQDERAQRIEIGVQLVDLHLQPGHLCGDDPQWFVGQRLARIGRGKVGAKVEQVVLDAHQHRVERSEVLRILACQPDKGIGLVDRAIGLDAQVAFQAARAGGQPVVPSSPVLV